MVGGGNKRYEITRIGREVVTKADRAVNEPSRAEPSLALFVFVCLFFKTVRVRLCSLRILKYCSCSCSFKLNELVRERYTNIEYVDEQLMNTFVNN